MFNKVVLLLASTCLILASCGDKQAVDLPKNDSQQLHALAVTPFMSSYSYTFPDASNSLELWLYNQPELSRSIAALGIQDSPSVFLSKAKTTYVNDERGIGTLTDIYVPLKSRTDLFFYIRKGELSKEIEVNDRPRTVTSYQYIVTLNKAVSDGPYVTYAIYDYKTNQVMLATGISTDAALSGQQLVIQGVNTTDGPVRSAVTAGLDPNASATRQLFSSSAETLTSQSTAIYTQSVTSPRGSNNSFCYTKIVRGNDVTTCYSVRDGYSHPTCLGVDLAYEQAGREFNTKAGGMAIDVGTTAYFVARKNPEAAYISGLKPAYTAATELAPAHQNLQIARSNYQNCMNSLPY